MKRKISLFVIPVLAITVFSSCLYRGINNNPQTLEEERILIKSHIMYLEKEGCNGGPCNVDTTELGVYYYFRKYGDGLTFPEMGDTLTVTYNGFLIDGTQFYTTDDLAEGKRNFVFGEEENVIAGWIDGLKVISKGATVELIIPSTLGFGSNWNGIVPPNNTLIFVVTMENIKKKKD